MNNDNKLYRMSVRGGLALWLGVSALALPACNEEEPGAQMDDGDVDPAEECDPVGADAQMGELLNAPVAADVEVIVKEPQHPGAAGPLDLP